MIDAALIYSSEGIYRAPSIVDRLADFICERLLDVFDPTGDHC